MASITTILLLSIPLILSILGYQYNKQLVQQDKDWKVTADRVRLPDGRHIAYEIVGNRKSKNPIFWFHGLASSRWALLWYECSLGCILIPQDIWNFRSKFHSITPGTMAPYALPLWIS